MNSLLEPFEIPPLTEEHKEILNDRLKSVIWPQELDKSQNVGWSYGAPSWAVKQVVDHWLNKFDWERERAQLNTFHHYKMNVNGFKMHLIHEPSKQANAKPLVLIHGWPGSFVEFRKVIAPLRDGADGKQAFHVVVVSLPGFGFSDPPTQKGFGLAQTAKTINQVMVNLGYNKYIAQGGDWGSLIGRFLAINHSKNCRGYHTNMPIPSPPLPTPTNLIVRPLSVLRMFGSALTGFNYFYPEKPKVLMGTGFANATWDSDAGYRAIQATRPYTLSFGLTDSPVGLMAWILEKFHVWTYHEGSSDEADLPSTISYDEFLTNVMVYWMTNTISSSTRIYYEYFNLNEGKINTKKIGIPTAAAVFQNEIIKVPEDWLKPGADLRQYTNYSVGGHFAAMEQSALLVDDIQRFGAKLKLKSKL
ncbi:Alpha/Beta hydrolase protein [Umbelopsis sp. PMI_123]|nr:Alpha/Beta hydrolase protein [Umbelopsis sp. PMI_123]